MFPHVMTVIGLVVVIVFTGLVLGFFDDRFWLPHDEGAYAHGVHVLADRYWTGTSLKNALNLV